MPLDSTTPRRLLLGIALTTLLTQPLQAETLSVCSGGGCDFSTIQAAIDSASDGDVIEVAPGSYSINQTIDTLGKAVRIVGSLEAKTGIPSTRLSGQNTQRVLQCINEEGPDTIFENLLISNGHSPENGGGIFIGESSAATLISCWFVNNAADGAGGGMYTASSSITLTDCWFVGNEADYAGGIHTSYSSATFTNCSFIDNTAHSHGGGMLQAYPSSSTLTNCTFNGNKSDTDSGGALWGKSCNSLTLDNCSFIDNQSGSHGGGIYIFNDSPTLTNCTFTDNIAVEDGGATYVRSASPDLTSCTFTNNWAANGGGMYIYQGYSTLTLTNCTFRDNSAAYHGGGMYNGPGSSPTLTDCTFTDNAARNVGGGLYNDDYSGSITLSSAIICGNTPDQILGGYTDRGENCVGQRCDECALDDKCPADLNDDGLVDGADLTIILSNWGGCP